MDPAGAFSSIQDWGHRFESPSCPWIDDSHGDRINSGLLPMFIITWLCKKGGRSFEKMLWEALLNQITTQCHLLMHYKRYMAVENIVRKGEIACNKQFLLFSQRFLSYMALIFHFKCCFKCHLQFVSIWASLKFYCLVMG